MTRTPRSAGGAAAAALLALATIAVKGTVVERGAAVAPAPEPAAAASCVGGGH